jgi:hypothetical protein
MGATNMSIQTTAEKSYMDRPSMKEDDHPEHNMPTPEHNGVSVTARINNAISDIKAINK